MISTRLGAAVSLVLSIVAVALGVAALMATVRDNGPTTGRLVQTRLTSSFVGDPLPFPIENFFMSRDGGGHIHALYAYPPGFFGHVRGCKIVWDATGTIIAGGSSYGPGLFVDPCGGARFDHDGRLLSGPADRDLDYFATSRSPDGIVVDTRKLYCGAAAGGETPTPEPVQTCPRVWPDTQR